MEAGRNKIACHHFVFFKNFLNLFHLCICLFALRISLFLHWIFPTCIQEVDGGREKQNCLPSLRPARQQKCRRIRFQENTFRTNTEFRNENQDDDLIALSKWDKETSSKPGWNITSPIRKLISTTVSNCQKKFFSLSLEEQFPKNFKCLGPTFRIKI